MKTQRTINFNKIQWADYHYVNQEGDVRRVLPRQQTVHGLEIDWRVQAAPHPDYPHETMLERAARLDILDIWTPRCRLVISANRELIYTGTAAMKIWKQYNRHIYGK